VVMVLVFLSLLLSFFVDNVELLITDFKTAFAI